MTKHLNIFSFTMSVVTPRSYLPLSVRCVIFPALQSRLNAWEDPTAYIIVYPHGFQLRWKPTRVSRYGLPRHRAEVISPTASMETQLGFSVWASASTRAGLLTHGLEVFPPPQPTAQQWDGLRSS